MTSRGAARDRWQGRRGPVAVEQDPSAAKQRRRRPRVAHGPAARLTGSRRASPGTGAWAGAGAHGGGGTLCSKSSSHRRCPPRSWRRGP
jgi:hypothetical protein